MKYGSLILEKREYVYLKRILNVSSYAGDFEIQKSLQKLSEELKEAQIVDNEKMPSDIIRFNSKATLIFENGIEKTLQLVIPTERDVNKNKVSILAPMGAALIGYAEGDTIIWDFPGGRHHLKIAHVNQEETVKGLNLVI
ncbi:GreA/GreB family elongation factor [Algibacter lectus]|uniref:Regulator of nucleoside diphosphate kinase n=1 Tax=Algibacter lectus TaxID=221126 RepID=A0A4V3HHB0_9FLAO|nr:GreA/GreB family elongation factor [Algibacter lectus]MWW25036.1 transcription elongation factor GreAB [Algibacter lectus]TDY64551.1 regulator of nucleoside diphosphate kinase [Algibacter lectus]